MTFLSLTWFFFFVFKRWPLSGVTVTFQVFEEVYEGAWMDNYWDWNEAPIIMVVSGE